MSCALPDEVEEHLAPRPAPAAASFQTHCAEGLHAMAQPLTILRGALGALAMGRHAASELHRYVDMSTREVDRLCDLLATMQDILDIARFEPECGSVNLTSLLQQVRKEVEPALAAADLSLAVPTLDRTLFAFADMARMTSSLIHAVKAAASVATAGEPIQLRVFCCDGYVDLVVQNPRHNSKNLNSSSRLMLSLVEDSLLTQHGIFECTENPLRISMRLPLQLSTPADTQESHNIPRLCH